MCVCVERAESVTALANPAPLCLTVVVEYDPRKMER